MAGVGCMMYTAAEIVKVAEANEVYEDKVLAGLHTGGIAGAAARHSASRQTVNVRLEAAQIGCVVDKLEGAHLLDWCTRWKKVLVDCRKSTGDGGCKGLKKTEVDPQMVFEDRWVDGGVVAVGLAGLVVHMKMVVARTEGGTVALAYLILY